MSKQIDPRVWEQGRKTYDFLQRMGYFRGYSIVGSDDKKECETCDEAQGDYGKISLDNPLPPFHPNCRCRVELNWKEVANLEIILREYWNPKTGEIKRDRWDHLPTRDLVTEAVNFFLKKQGVDENLSWDEIVYFGFEDKEGNKYEGETYDAVDLVGWKARVINWNVFMASRLDKFRSGEYKYRDYYDPESGKISVKSDGSAPSRQEIADAVNFFLRKECGLEEGLSWEEIAETGFYDKNNNKSYYGIRLKPEELIGLKTHIDINTVVDISPGGARDPKDTLEYWIWDAIAYGTSSDAANSDWICEEDVLRVLINTWNGFWQSYEGSTYDLKTQNETVFGQPGGKRKYWGYVWHGKFLTYDEPGNITIEALAGALDMPWDILVSGAHGYAVMESLWNERKISFDDERDIENFRRGYEIGQSAL